MIRSLTAKDGDRLLLVLHIILLPLLLSFPGHNEHTDVQ